MVLLFRLLIGAAVGAFIGLFTCLVPTFRFSLFSGWSWIVITMSGLLIGVVVAWRGHQMRRFLQSWIWWFP
jgi:uncharacterized membrane protein SpoIIM required for sporulation